MAEISLADYVDRMTDGVEQFFSQHPGYYAVFIEVQARLPEVNDADDARLIQTIATLLPKRNPPLNADDYQAIAFIMVKAIGNFMWLSLGQSPDFRQRLVKETKRMTLSYLQSYFS